MIEKKYKLTRVRRQDRNNKTVKVKTNHEDMLFEVASSLKRQVNNHQRPIGFNQVHKDGYQRFSVKECKDIGVDVLDS